jgi:hypothetical protein
MNVSEVTLTKVFPVQKEHTYDGVLTRFVAIGHGKTICISQIEDQPLYIDIYGLEVNSVEDLQSSNPEKSVQLAQVMPTGDALYRLAADFLGK